MATQMESRTTSSRSRRTSPTPPRCGPRPSMAAERSPVHLTRRGRVLLLALLVAVLFGAFSLGRAAPQAASVNQSGPVLEQVTVQQGESLWTVARRIAPHNDPREVIAQIRRLNDLATWQLQAGQQLLLPVPG